MLSCWQYFPLLSWSWTCEAQGCCYHGFSQEVVTSGMRTTFSSHSFSYPFTALFHLHWGTRWCPKLNDQSACTCLITALSKPLNSQLDVWGGKEIKGGRAPLHCSRKEDIRMGVFMSLSLLSFFFPQIVSSHNWSQCMPSATDPPNKFLVLWTSVSILFAVLGNPCLSVAVSSDKSWKMFFSVLLLLNCTEHNRFSTIDCVLQSGLGLPFFPQSLKIGHLLAKMKVLLLPVSICSETAPCLLLPGDRYMW